MTTALTIFQQQQAQQHAQFQEMHQAQQGFNQQALNSMVDALRNLQESQTHQSEMIVQEIRRRTPNHQQMDDTNPTTPSSKHMPMVKARPVLRRLARSCSQSREAI